MRKVVVAGMLGNALEWYDFALYAYVAAIISHLFFPGTNEIAGLIATFGIFAVGFLMRPIGAIIFGMIGDRYGRKLSLTISILMMAIPTTCIGLLPGYEVIGIWAPILLTILRLFQGLSLGGEFSGSIAFIVEHSPSNHRGIMGSTSMLSLVLGMLLATGVIAVCEYSVGEEVFRDWGWRIPFLLGIVMGLVGMYIRSHLDESPHYTNAKEEGNLSDSPLKDACVHHWKEMLQSIGVYLVVTVPFYVIAVFMKTYMVTFAGYSSQDASFLNTMIMVAMAITIPIAGWLSDKVGRKLVLRATCILFMLITYPMFMVVVEGHSSHATTILILFAMIVGLCIGPVPALLVELFPTSVRYTGMAASYNIGAALFGGTLPIVATWMINRTGDTLIVSYYIIACAMISFLTLFSFAETYKEPLK